MRLSLSLAFVGLNILVMLFLNSRWSSGTGITNVTIDLTDGWEITLACQNNEIEIYKCNHDELVISKIPPAQL